MLHFENRTEGNHSPKVAIDNELLEKLHKLARKEYPKKLIGVLRGPYEKADSIQVTSFELYANRTEMENAFYHSPNDPIVGFFRITPTYPTFHKDEDSATLFQLKQSRRPNEIQPIALIIEVLEDRIDSRHHKVYDEDGDDLDQKEICNGLMGNINHPYKEGDMVEIKAKFRYNANGEQVWEIASSTTHNYRSRTVESADNVLKAIAEHFDSVECAENDPHEYLIP